MILFIQPLFFFIILAFWYILCAPFWIVYAFWISTSRAQLPAQVARQFAKRGMASEAARWYLCEVRQSRCEPNMGRVASVEPQAIGKASTRTRL